MKALTVYINEKLVLNKNTFKKPEYKYFPETKEELQNILYKLLKERKDNNVIDLNDIDISNVTDMSYLFQTVNLSQKIINIDVSNWNMSKVENIDEMFFRCENLESIGDLSSWNVSNVNTMYETFLFCQNLKSIGNLFRWNVSKVTNMESMFSHCENLKSVGDLSKWNVSKVEDMEGMFEHCYNLKNVGNLNKWNVKESTNMYDMFLFSLINIPTWYKE